MKIILYILFVPAFLAMSSFQESTQKQITHSAVIGKWVGEINENQNWDRQRPDNTKTNNFNILIHFEIKEDGTVNGKIGNAILENCEFKKNRNRFGKFINIKTDYIITGYIKKSVYDVNDSDYSTYFMFPFNIESNGHMKGFIHLKNQSKGSGYIIDIQKKQI